MKKIAKKIAGSFIKIAVAVFFIIALFLTFKAGDLVKQASGLINQLSDMRGVMSEFGQDLNEMREYLLLPKRDYSFFDVKNEFSPDDQPFVNLGIEKFATELGTNYLLEKNQKASYQFILDLKNNTDFYNELKNIGLLPARVLDDQKETTILKFYKGNEPIAELILNKNNAEFNIQSIIGSYKLIPNNENTLQNLVIDNLKKNKDHIILMKEHIHEQQKMFKTIWDDTSVKSLLSEKNLQPSLHPFETDYGFEYVINDADIIPVLSISINRKNGNFSIQGTEYENVENLLQPLLTELKSLKGESVRMQAIQKKQDELIKLLSSADFIDSLDSAGVKIDEPKEEGRRIYYDLLNTDDEYKLGSIIFEKETGDVMFFRSHDGAELNIDQIFVGLKKN